MFLTKDEVLMWVKTPIKNISASSLTLLIFAVGWGALFYSPVDFTDASDLHQSVQV